MGRRSAASRRAILGALLLGAALPAPATAHPLAPALLEIEERADGRALVLWRTSALRPAGTNPRPVLPEDCTQLGDASLREVEAALETRWEIRCPGGLVGRQVGALDLERARIDALVRIALTDGRVVQRVLRPGEPRFVVPARARPLEVLRSYAALGARHILLGVDHLLFVFGLLLLVGRRTGPLVKTVSAFTVGHSVTLVLATLGLVRVPQAPVELFIAVSVLVLAVELAGRPSRSGPLRRRPWALALLFGLLHGLGFAGALAEVGLPQADIPLALFSFNVGIELGQLAFVAGVVLARRLVAGPLERLPSWSRAVPIYALGSLSAYWCFERAAALVGAG